MKRSIGRMFKVGLLSLTLAAPGIALAQSAGGGAGGAAGGSTTGTSAGASGASGTVAPGSTASDSSSAGSTSRMNGTDDPGMVAVDHKTDVNGATNPDRSRVSGTLNSDETTTTTTRQQHKHTRHHRAVEGDSNASPAPRFDNSRGPDGMQPSSTDTTTGTDRAMPMQDGAYRGRAPSSTGGSNSNGSTNSNGTQTR